ncbi:hypothetical protein GCM10010174_32100 [Kutzneria viridogrisea]|uniref:AlgX/AlgJ SGNH hydrolase-like domain-containing protein n=2 Tax=Kutzneria TaxID=43356 RepID=W5VYD0_9PSEU|nr:hypothetical protein [Kutzneria albida]AHH93445.1 hypothetical protein KALB_68 [Kutzneria albida DSM 43870]MBA8929170.1 hypothetical protein [Kutzneria viridogrisea]
MQRSGEDTQPIPRHESWLPTDHPLYRPRHGRQRFSLISALVFFLTPVVGLVLFGPPPSIENRAVHQFPSLSQGWGFFTGLAPWAVDNLSFRPGAISLNDAISRGLFGEAPMLGGGEPNQSGPIAPAPTGPQSPQSGTTDIEPPPVAGFPRVVEGKNGWMYFGVDMQSRCQPTVPLDQVLSNLARLKWAVENSGRRFVFVVPPDKSTQEPENLPDHYAGKSCSEAFGQQFWPRLVSETGALDLREALRAEAAKHGGHVYFPQDTHWTYDGGLVMTKAIAEKVLPGTTSTWRVAQTGTRDGVADLPPMIGRTGVDNINTYMLAPDGRTDRSPRTTPDPRTVATYTTNNLLTGMIPGKTTLVSDSFTNFAIPFVGAAFADVSIANVALVQADPNAEAQRMVDSDTVVVEVVERNITSGVSPIVQQPIVDTLVQALLAHPRR